ncbi:uncharacterized protein LOC142231708 isoform X3 [Haematobia irritans]|uniref:uncharacterized protein LOC142231708 isoform X3 n=1 Tax=Haematobia irritans TaxID=7368 RepID=UPI003F501766
MLDAECQQTNFRIMSVSNICRLCRNSCDNSLRLNDDKGNPNHIYNTVIKYFDPMILKGDPGDTSDTVLCTECWYHISSFDSFQQTVMLIQANLLAAYEEDHVEIVKEERIEEESEFIESQDTIEIEEFITIMPNSNGDNGGANNTSQEDAIGFGSGKLVEADIAIEFSNNLDDIAENRTAGPSQSFTVDLEFQGKDDDRESCIVIHSDESDPEMPVTIERSNRSQDLWIEDSTDQTSSNKSTIFSKTFEANRIIAKWKPLLDCYICLRQFPSFIEVRRHMNAKHPGEEFYILCCHRKFKLLHFLEDHAMLHMDPNAFTCQKCGRNYQQKFRLMQHIDEAHGKRKPFSKPPTASSDTCHTCHKTFPYKGGLYHHNKIHHPDIFAKRTRRRTQVLKGGSIVSMFSKM